MSQTTSHPLSTLAEARHVVENELAAYCAAVDDRDTTHLRDLLADTDVTFRGTPVDGDIGEFYQRAFANGPATLATRHFYTNLTVLADADADTKDQVRYQASYQRWEHTGGRPECVALGRYEGAFRATTDDTTRAWTWATHRITTD